MNRLFVIFIMVLGLVLVGGVAQADTCDFDANGGSSGDWDVAANWACVSGGEQVPTAADLAVIKSGKTCNVNVTTAVADSLTVESTATLNVQASKKLTLNSSDTNTTITGTGRVYLQGSGSELAFIDNSQTIDGSGKIVGQDSAAKITVVANRTLTLSGTTEIEGELKITGAGDFVNFSKVHANVAGTLEISTNTFDDDNTAVWQISTSSSAIMLLNATSATAAALEGAFTVSAGTMDVDAPGFETSGRLTYTGGTIDASGLSGSEVVKFTG